MEGIRISNSNQSNNLNNNTNTNYQHHHHHRIRKRRTLQDCFDIFAILPSIITDLIALERITYETLEDFASHHVTYLELRSTPKRLLVEHHADQNVMASKRQYIETVLEVISTFNVMEEQRYEKEMINYKLQYENDKMKVNNYNY